MILTIDPGINNCGVAIIDLSSTFKVIEITNIKNIRKLTDSEKDIELKYGLRTVKVLSIHKVLLDLINRYNITSFVIEAPFYNALTPVAFGSLLEVIMSIKYSIIIPNNINLKLIEPLLVKKVFTNKSQAKKELMRESLISKINANTILLNEEVSSLTEHEVDAIAVGFTYFKNLNLGE